MRLYWYVCALYSVWVDIFVYIIQSNHFLCAVFGVLFYISPVSGLFYHCVVVKDDFELTCLWISYLFLLQFIFLLYTIYSLVGIQIGKIFVYTYWFIMSLLPALLNCIQKSGLTPIFKHLPLSCHMHWNTYTCS